MHRGGHIRMVGCTFGGNAIYCMSQVVLQHVL